MVYLMYNADMIKDCRYCSEKSVASIDDAIITPLMSKIRGDLVLECAFVCEIMKKDHAYVKNICADRKNGMRYETQSWYVFKENGQWYYKQTKNTKAKHEIPFKGAVA